MDLTGAATKTTFTDAQGYYNFNSLSNGSYSVSPKWELGDIYEFYPSSIVVSVNGQNVENVNFTAKKIIIKGTVADSSGKGIEGIKMKVGDIESYTNEEGSFSFSGLCPGEYILEPSNEAKTNFTFSPPNRKIVIKENDDCHDHQNFNVKRK
ncbi:MAG: collagen binding domain-containing protein [Acidobacteriota bacterium]